MSWGSTQQTPSLTFGESYEKGDAKVSNTKAPGSFCCTPGAFQLFLSVLPGYLINTPAFCSVLKRLNLTEDLLPKNERRMK